MSKLTIRRYTDNQRLLHWLVVVLFGMAGFSGLALFHPNLYFLTQFFGGGQWARIVHPYFGIAMFVLFFIMAVGFWRANLWTRRDSEWLANADEIVKGNSEAMPPVHKYNAGQKLVFWLMLLTLTALIVTGVLFWQPWFGEVVPIPLQRLAAVVHAFSAFILSLGVVVHIYAAIWVKGSLRAMTQGTVTAAWARHHHRLWYEDKMAGRAQPPRQS